MNPFSEPRRRWLQRAVALPCLVSGWALAGLPHGNALTAEPFDASTWGALMKAGPRPAAYVFTATYCSSCPAVFTLLHQAANQPGRPRAEIVAVLVNVQDAEAQAHVAHYRGVTRLFAFDGQEARIRYSVDPKWRNITPYVVLVDRHGGLQRCTGQPSVDMLRTWLD